MSEQEFVVIVLRRGKYILLVSNVFPTFLKLKCVCCVYMLIMMVFLHRKAVSCQHIYLSAQLYLRIKEIPGFDTFFSGKFQVRHMCEVLEFVKSRHTPRLSLGKN